MRLKRLRTQPPRSLTNCGHVCALAALVVAACSSKLELPPALGNCMPVDDAGCTVSRGAGGSVTPPEASVGAEPDGMGTVPEDGSTCGSDTLGLSSSNTYCLPCIEQASPTGCCEDTAACATDSMCQMRVLCALGGGGQGPTGLANCLTPADTTYTELAGCVANRCLACGDLSRLLSPPGDM
jgi:hypothetical protein